MSSPSIRVAAASEIHHVHDFRARTLMVDADAERCLERIGFTDRDMPVVGRPVQRVVRADLEHRRIGDVVLHAGAQLPADEELLLLLEVGTGPEGHRLPSDAAEHQHVAIVAMDAERRRSIGSGVDTEMIPAGRIPDAREEMVQDRREAIAHHRDVLFAVVEDDAYFVAGMRVADPGDVVVAGLAGTSRQQRSQPIGFDLLTVQSTGGRAVPAHRGPPDSRPRYRAAPS